jgi:HEAT repeat protein
MPSPSAWLPQSYHPDPDLRIQALNMLIRTDAARVIPMLKEIVLESDPSEARRAVFVLMQSGRPEARETVVELAKSGPEPAQIAAIRELGRFGGPEISQELLQVYSSARLPVKREVVLSLGERLERAALLRIAQTEKDPHLRERAIVTLGQAGGSEQLRILYRQATAEAKRPIIVGLFNARDEDELIRIAEHERDPELREEALRRLRLLGTPKAKAYLEKAGRGR